MRKIKIFDTTLRDGEQSPGASRNVEVVTTIPDSLHAPIRYPAALVSRRSPASTRRWLATLRSAAARAVFRRHGFTLLTASE